MTTLIWKWKLDSSLAISLCLNLCFWVSICGSLNAEARVSRMDPKRLQEFVTTSASRGHFSGVIGVLDATGNAIWATGGQTHLGGPVPSLKTRFHMASLSKMFTHIAALRAHEKGVLDLDLAVRSQLPSNLKAPSRTEKNLGEITVRDLLHHAPGYKITSNALKEVLQEEVWTEQDLLDNIEIQKVKDPFYCNACFDLAGIVIEHSTKRNLMELFREEISRSSESVSYDQPLLDLSKEAKRDLASGMWQVGFLWTDNFFNLNTASGNASFRGAGSLIASAEELFSVLRNLNSAGGAQSVAPNVLDSLMKSASFGPYGGGLIKTKLERWGDLYWHNGAEPTGYSSALFFCLRRTCQHFCSRISTRKTVPKNS